MGDVEEDLRIKCMIVGDGLTGKTHLFKKLTNQKLPTSYSPTVFDISELEVQSKTGSKMKLTLWDSSGLRVYDNIRPISYAHTDCFIVCYSVCDKSSFENVLSRWIPEINKHGDGPTVPVILVATKYDVMEHPKCEGDDDYVTESQGKALQEQIGAKAFFSSSAIAELCLIDILQAAIDLAYMKKEDEDQPSDPIWKFCSATVVCIGDSGVGKSSLLEACLTSNLSTIQQGKDQTKKLQEYYHDVVRNGCEYFLRFVEVPCEHEYLNTFIQQPKNADVLLLCYAINDPFSFQTIESLLNGELKDQLRKIPAILIGTKSDLKSESLCVIPTIDGELVKENMKCATFVECSARTQENISQVLGAMIDNIKDQQ